MFFSTLFLEELFKCFQTKKLRFAKAKWTESDKHFGLEEYGDCTVMNAFSRLGGRFREWDRVSDEKDFVTQELNGEMIR